MSQKDILKETYNDVFAAASVAPKRLENTEDEQALLTRNKQKDELSLNYSTQRAKLHNKAKKTIESLLKFYFEQDIIDKDEYLKQKALSQEADLGDIMNQIENSSKAIDTLMSAIDLGAVTPRMFEALSGAQQTFMELIKLKTNVLIQIEDSAKQMISDRNIYKVKTEVDENVEEANVKTFSMRGTKGLMNNLQDLIKQKKLEESENQ